MDRTPIAPWEQVDARMDSAAELAKQQTLNAQELAEALTGIVPPFGPDYTLGTQHNLSVPTLNPLVAPSKPEAQETLHQSFTWLLESLPDTTQITPQFPEFHTQPPEAPYVNIPAPPTLAALPSVPLEPFLEEVSVPEYEGHTLPEVPQLSQLSIPDLIQVDFKDYDVERPELKVPELYDDDFIGDVAQIQDSMHGAMSAYVDDDATVAATRDTLNRILGGQSTGLPPEFEAVLFARAIERENVASAKAMETARNEWASRGFSLPGSVLLARDTEILIENRRALGEANREITLQVHSKAFEALQAAVAQGVALQGQMFQQFNDTYVNVLKAADSAYAVHQNLMQAGIDLVRIEMEVYRTDIEAFKQHTEIQLARLQVYRTQLEAERVKGEINQQQVQIYLAQLQSVMTGVEVFKSRVQAANTLVQMQMSKVDIFKAKLDGYKTVVDTQRLQMDLHESAVRSEEAKTRVYTSQVQGFLGEVQAYQASTGAEASRVSALASLNKDNIDRFKSSVDAFSSVANIDVAQIRAATGKFTADIASYQAQSQVAISSAQLGKEVGQLGLLSHDMAEKNTLAAAQLNVEKVKSHTALALEAGKSAAAVYSQLSAAALSAINVSASVSGSGSNSWSESHSHSYQYEG